MAFSITESVNNAVNTGKKTINKFYPSKAKDLVFQDFLRQDRFAPSWRWAVILPQDLVTQLDQWACEKISASPGGDINTTSKFFQGRELDLPGNFSLPKLKITFSEYEDYRTTNFFTDWRRKVYDPITRSYGTPYGKNGFAKPLTITLYSLVNKTPDKYASIQIDYCYPVTIDAFDLGGEDFVKVNVEFAVHGITFTPGNNLPTGQDSTLASVVNSVTKYLI